MIWIIHTVGIFLFFTFSKLFNQNNFFINGSFMFVIFVYGQRWLTGTDFPNYLRYYISHFTRFEEFLYFGLQETFSYFNLYFGLFLTIILFISMFNFYKFILKINKAPEIMIVIFLFSEMFFAQLSQIRQFVAISFFIHGFYYAYQKKNLKGIFMIIIGGLFHKTAYFMLPFLFVKPKQNKVTSLYLLGASAFLPLLDIRWLFTLPIFSNYSNYVESVYSVNLSPFHFIRYYLLLLIVILIIWNLDRINNESTEQMILNGLILYFIIYGLSFQFGILMRVSLYFKIFEFIMIVYFSTRIKNMSKLLTHIMTASLFFGIYTGLVVTDPYDISLYEFRPMRIIDTRSYDYFDSEISRFYEEINR